MAQTVDVLIEGGKATAAPPLGPALGPTGVNIGQVVADINKKTAALKGMQVPVKVTINDDKTYDIKIGTPPASALIKKEAEVPKGAGNPLTEKVADLLIEQIIKVALTKKDDLIGKDLKNKCKEIMGTCDSMGILVEGVTGREAIKLVDQGKFDKEIAEEKTELTEEEKVKVAEERQRLKAEMEKKRAMHEKQGQAILKEMEGKDNSKIRAKMLEAGIPTAVVNKLAPEEKKAK